MRYLKHSALLWFALNFPPTAHATDISTQAVLSGDELRTTYPNPPKKLDTDSTMSAVLLLDIDLKGALGNSRVSGAALVRDGNGLIRAAPMKGDLVMFHGLEPGTYSLRFIKVEVFIGGDLQPREILVLEKPPTLEITVTVARGGIHYVGSVVVKGKVGLLGSKPPELQLTYDARREIEAWSAFRKKYADSPWAALAERRMLALRSPQQAQGGASVLAAPENRDSANSAAMEQKMLALNEISLAHARNGEYGAAVRALEEAMSLKPESSDLARNRTRRWVQNNLAWLLATAPDSAVRDGPRALVLAEQLVSWKRDDPAYLDTFAAAYAEVGHFDDAVKTQRQALAGLGGGSLRDEYRKHLRSYEDRKPWRE